MEVEVELELVVLLLVMEEKVATERKKSLELHRDLPPKQHENSSRIILP